MMVRGTETSSAYDIDDFCFRLPKCELHAHLSGSISMETVEKLAEMKAERDVNYGGLSDTERELLKPTQRQRSLEEVFRIFPIIQNLIERKEDLTMVTMDVIRDFASENVVYLELRSTPKSTEQMSQRDYVDAIVEGMKLANRELSDITVRLILSVDRRHTLEQAKQIVQMAIELVGVELSGDPKHDARKFLPLFEDAKRAGICTTLHLAESADYLDELGECLELKADRIGHGTFIHLYPDTLQRAKFIEAVIERRTPIEICLTSNVVSNTTPSYAESHLGFYLEQRHPVVLCTDDRGLMRCSLSGEFAIAARTFGLSRQQLLQISRTAFESAFIHRNEDFKRDTDRISSILDNFAIAEDLN